MFCLALATASTKSQAKIRIGLRSSNYGIGLGQCASFNGGG